MTKDTPSVELSVGGTAVRISNPDRAYFPEVGATKLDVARYYLSVGDGIVRALAGRPCMLHRFPNGVGGEKVHQKRLPAGAPPWIETVRVEFPSGRHADELCVTNLAGVIWAVQMSTVEFHPWNSRRSDVERPDEWRIDLDPMPGCDFRVVRQVAHVAREVLDEIGAPGWPKTSGGSGLHVYVRLEPRWPFTDVRRAALAFAKEVERRILQHATTAWWRKDRDPTKVFIGLQPERPRPHHRQRILAPRRAACHRLNADHLGRDRRRCAPGLHPLDRASAVRRAGRPASWHRRRALLARHPPRMGGAG